MRNKGKSVAGTHDRAYKIVRMFFRDDKATRTITTGLTLVEAQAHCHNPETSSSTAQSAKAVRLSPTESITMYNKYGYDKDGYNKDGYNRAGYDKDGYNKAGYDKDGYNRAGYNWAGYNWAGYYKDGYNWAGYDKDGYDWAGYDKAGYDKAGYDKDGYYKDGYNKYGYLAGWRQGPFDIVGT